MSQQINIPNIEKMVLSSIIFDPDNFYYANKVLKPGDFYVPVYQKVFEAMKTLEDQELPLDEEFIIQVSKISQDILADIMLSNPISDIKAYVGKIKDSSVKRELLKLTTTIKKIVDDENINSAETLQKVEDELFKISNSSNILKNRTTNEIFESFKLKHKKAQNSELETIKSGIDSLDNLIGGFEKGSYIIIGARPSMGKTSLATQIMLNALSQNKGVLFYSLEMSGEDIILKTIAQKNQENITDLKKGLVKDFKAFNETLNYLQNNKNIYINDELMSFNQLKSDILKARRERDKKNLTTDLVIIDHLGYIKLNHKLQKHDEIADGSKIIKELAKTLNITFVVLTQINRNVTDRGTKDNKNRPQLSDIRSSGSIEEDCDVAIFPHRESYYNRSNKGFKEDVISSAELLVLKNRTGKTGIANCQFKSSTNTFGYFPIIETVYQYDYKEDDNINIPLIEI